MLVLIPVILISGALLYIKANENFKKGERTKSVAYLTAIGFVCVGITAIPSVSQAIALTVATKDMTEVPSSYQIQYVCDCEQEKRYFYDTDNNIWQVHLKSNVINPFAGVEKEKLNEKYKPVSESDIKESEVPPSG